MSFLPTATGEQLASALNALGVRFLMASGDTDESLHEEPVQLIAALAKSNEARLRLALIPLFLKHPEFTTRVRAAAQDLGASERLTLQCYYSAAVWLGEKHQPDKKPLPDLFSEELGLAVTKDPDENLRRLADRHQELSGADVNWLGTYQHAAQKWFRQARGEQ